jgi:hypothetical protein
MVDNMDWLVVSSAEKIRGKCAREQDAGGDSGRGAVCEVGLARW